MVIFIVMSTILYCMMHLDRKINVCQMAMVGTPSHIMARQIQLRFECTQGNTLSAAQTLGMYFGRKKLRYATFYTPSYNDKAIVFKFSNSQDKENVINHPNLEADILVQAKCKPYKNPNGPAPDKYHRMIFAYGLNPLYFYLQNINDDGHDVNETLEGKVEAFKNQLKESQPDEAIEHVHFIQHPDNRGNPKAPRTMIITFKNLETAQSFLEEDTGLEMGMILSKNKKFHNHVQPRQCPVCKKTTHRRGDYNCDRIQRCPRCLSQQHFTPTEVCEPRCWSHGRGHSSASEKCPNIIAYKKQQRTMQQNKERIEKQVATTPAEQVQFHKDILNLQNNIRSNTNSYASRVKGNTPNSTNGNNANANPGLSIGATSFDATVFAAAYTAACLSEAFDPGSFQVVMEDFGRANNMPHINYPTPRLALLKALAPTAPAVVQASIDADNVSVPNIVQPAQEEESDDDDIPNINLPRASVPSFSGVVASTSSSSSSSQRRTPDTGTNRTPLGGMTVLSKSPHLSAQVTPTRAPTTLPARANPGRVNPIRSPVSTRQGSAMLKDIGHCNKVIGQTRKNKITVATTSIEQEFLETWKAVDNISIAELHELITQGIFKITPSRNPIAAGIPNVTSSMIKEFASKDCLKNKMVYYSLELSVMNNPDHCRKIIVQTQANPIKLITLSYIKTLLGADDFMSVEKLHSYLSQGAIKMESSLNASVVEYVPNITRPMINSFAKNEELKTKLVYYRLAIATLSL